MVELVIYALQIFIQKASPFQSVKSLFAIEFASYLRLFLIFYSNLNGGWHNIYITFCLGIDNAREALNARSWLLKVRTPSGSSFASLMWMRWTNSSKSCCGEHIYFELCLIWPRNTETFNYLNFLELQKPWLFYKGNKQVLAVILRFIDKRNID